MKYVVNNDVVLSRPPEGPLAAHIGALPTGLASRDTRWLPGAGK
jgi:hypothetical protein